MPEDTLKALADHGELGKIMAVYGGDCEKILAEFAKAGINVDSLAAQLAGRECKIVCEILERIAGGDRRGISTRSIHPGKFPGGGRQSVSDQRAGTHSANQL